MMQTMNSHELQPPPFAIRVLLLILGVSTVVGAILSLAGVPLGFFYLVPLAMAFLVLRLLGIQERAQAKKKAPGRSARPGA
jgi:hypothetical protein